MTRRKFAGSFVVVLALLSSTACPFFSNIYKTITQYVPLALLAFDRIIDILLANGVPIGNLTNGVNAVKAAFADIQSAIREFEETHHTEEHTKIEAIRTALKIAHLRLNDFWESLRIPNQQLAVTVKALLGIIISTLDGFIAQLPGAGAAAIPRTSFVSNPKPRSLKEFRADFNWILDHNGLSKYAL